MPSLEGQWELNYSPGPHSKFCTQVTQGKSTSFQFTQMWLMATRQEFGQKREESKTTKSHCLKLQQPGPLESKLLTQIWFLHSFLVYPTSPLPSVLLLLWSPLRSKFYTLKYALFLIVLYVKALHTRMIWEKLSSVYPSRFLSETPYNEKTDQQGKTNTFNSMYTFCVCGRDPGKLSKLSAMAQASTLNTIAGKRQKTLGTERAS